VAANFYDRKYKTLDLGVSSHASCNLDQDGIAERRRTDSSSGGSTPWDIVSLFLLSRLS
jgi:hypothetical protein